MSIITITSALTITITTTHPPPQPSPPPTLHVDHRHRFLCRTGERSRALEEEVKERVGGGEVEVVVKERVRLITAMGPQLKLRPGLW